MVVIENMTITGQPLLEDTFENIFRSFNREHAGLVLIILQNESHSGTRRGNLITLFTHHARISPDVAPLFADRLLRDSAHAQKALREVLGDDAEPAPTSEPTIDVVPFVGRARQLIASPAVANGNGDVPARVENPNNVSPDHILAIIAYVNLKTEYGAFESRLEGVLRPLGLQVCQYRDLVRRLSSSKAQVAGKKPAHKAPPALDKDEDEDEDDDDTDEDDLDDDDDEEEPVAEASGALRGPRVVIPTIRKRLDDLFAKVNLPRKSASRRFTPEQTVIVAAIAASLREYSLGYAELFRTLEMDTFSLRAQVDKVPSVLSARDAHALQALENQMLQPTKHEYGWMTHDCEPKRVACAALRLVKKGNMAVGKFRAKHGLVTLTEGDLEGITTEELVPQFFASAPPEVPIPDPAQVQVVTRTRAGADGVSRKTGRPRTTSSEPKGPPLPVTETLAELGEPEKALQGIPLSMRDRIVDLIQQIGRIEVIGDDRQVQDGKADHRLTQRQKLLLADIMAILREYGCGYEELERALGLPETSFDYYTKDISSRISPEEKHVLASLAAHFETLKEGIKTGSPLSPQALRAGVAMLRLARKADQNYVNRLKKDCGLRNLDEKQFAGFTTRQLVPQFFLVAEVAVARVAVQAEALARAKAEGQAAPPDPLPAAAAALT